MYQQPPPYGYPPAGYGTPAPPSGGGFFPPPPGYRFASATPSPRGAASKHARRASHQVPPGYSSSGYSPRVPPQFANDPRFASAKPFSPLRKPEFVSGFDYYDGQTRPRAPAFERMRPGKQYRGERYGDERYREHRRWSFAAKFHDVDPFDDEYYGGTPPPPYEDYRKFAAADYHYYQDREPERETATPKANSKQRRASYAPGPSPHDRSYTTPPRPKAAPAKRKATEEDRLRCKIPAGYSLKNWDPSEEPIMLLGSVFDANSLGKWIYDWSCYAFGSDKPLTDMAAELWLLLIHLAGKYKRADEVIDRVRIDQKREMVEDFLESGERLWIRFRKLLKVCEDYMWKAAQAETGKKKPVAMGPTSGVAFVKCLFGRECELEKTEKLMANIRLFSMRFEANIECILRNPEAVDADPEESEAE